MAKTILCSGGSSVNTTATTKYFVPGASLFANTIENQSKLKFRSAGTLSGFQVVVSANAGTQDVTARTRKNESNGGQTATILAGQTGIFGAASGTDTIASADYISYQIAFTQTNSITVTSISTLFAATTNTVTKFTLCKPSTSYTASTNYYYPISGPLTPKNTTEANTKVRMRKAGTFKNLFVRCSAQDTTTTVTLRKNGADSALTVLCTTSGGLGEFEDTSNTVSCAVDDEFDIEYFNGTNTGSGLNTWIISVEFETTDGSGATVAGSGTGLIIAKNTSLYIPIGGELVGSTTQSSVQIEAKEAFTFTDLECFISANGTDNVPPNSFELIVGGSIIAGSAAPGNTTGLKQDTTSSYTVASSDLVNLKLVNGDVSGGTHNMTVTWAAVFYSSSTGPQTYNRSPSDTVTLGQSLVVKLTAKRQMQDTVSLSQSLNVDYKGKRVMSDTVNLSQSLTRTAAYRRNLSDTVNLSENAIGSKVTIRSGLSDSISLSESINVDYKATRILSDTVNLSQSLIRTLFARRFGISDSVTLSESLIRQYKALRTAQDSVGFSESLNVDVMMRRSVSDTVILSENLVRTAAYKRSLLDSVGLSENIFRSIINLRSGLSDSVSLSESIDPIVLINRLISDTVNLSESIIRRYNAKRVAEDTVTLGESISSQFIEGGADLFQRTASDTVTLGESINVDYKATRSVSDTVNLSENVNRIVGYKRSVQDTTSLSESIIASKTFNRSAMDSVAFGESIIRRYNGLRMLSDSVILSQNLVRTLSAKRFGISDSVTLSESIITMKLVQKMVSDNISLGESITRKYSGVRAISDSTPTNESVNRILMAKRFGLSDSVSLSESIIAKRVVIKSVSDIVTLGESISRTLNAIRTVSDSVIQSESILSIFIQDPSNYVTVASEVMIRDLAHQTSEREIETDEMERAINYGDARMFADTGQAVWELGVDSQYQNAVNLASTYGAYYALMMQNESVGAALLLKDAATLKLQILNAKPDPGERGVKNAIARSRYRSHYINPDEVDPWRDPLR